VPDRRPGYHPCDRHAEELLAAPSKAELLALIECLTKREAELEEATRRLSAEHARRRSPHHEISLDFDPPEIVINADAQRIGEVVNNLLDNAVKYSPGGGHVRIRGRIIEEHALITITDEGIGITAEDMRRIFERFYRGQNAVSAVTRGAGLGLSLCRGIVEAHAGKIWVDSEQDVGTSVSFALPTFETGPEEIQ